MNFNKGLNTLLTFVLFFFVFLPTAYGQTTKHPRVAEVEKYLSREALDLLKARFPEHPFMATVSIDPVHRGNSANSTTGEKLPYLEVDSEEIVDEWDDPALTNMALLSRVKKVVVTLSLPDTLSDDEVSEIKSSLYSSLNLIEARDTVDIRKRNFAKNNSFIAENFGSFIALSSLICLMILLGFGGLFWFLSARIKSGMKDIKIHNSESAGGTTNVSPSLPELDSTQERSSKSVSQISGDVKFSDPFKIKEIISTYVAKIEAMPTFPNFKQMVAIDEFCHQFPNECGSLLYELPNEIMKKLFSYSTENYWLVALSEPKDMNSGCIELLNKLVRIQDSGHPELEETLIQMWRLGKDLPLFVRTLNQNEAFTLIDHLPASQGLAVAREIYPGSWGALLNKTYNTVEFKPDRIEFLDKQLKKMKPLRDMSYISKFKHDQDLVKFLHITDPQTEKEIYQAHGNPEELTKLRKPFYCVLEASDSIKKIFAQKVNIEDWAYSFFNLPRSERRNFETYFSDKQKFRYLEILKQLDQNNPSPEVVGRVREKIASSFYKFKIANVKTEENEKKVSDLLEEIENQKAS